MTILALVLTLTAYAPACGGINGSLSNHYADGSSRPQPAHHMTVAACGRQFAFGTVLRVYGLEHVGITEVVCHDRGSAVTGVDVLSYTGDGCALDRQIAMHIGRRRLRVAVLSRDTVIQNKRSGGKTNDD